MVEQYAENSRDVWEGAKVSPSPSALNANEPGSNIIQFWKQFFEASANVSLSGYEEKPNEDTTVQEEEPTATEEDSATNLTETASLDDGHDGHHDVDVSHKPDDLDLTSLSLSHSTPRAPSTTTTTAHGKPADADITSSSIAYSSSSPYENLKKQINETDSPFDVEDSNLPSTPPGKSSFRQYRGTPMSPSSSPFVPPVSHEKPSTSTPFFGRSGHDHGNGKPSDPVMHRMADKTYRVQATPLGKGAAAAAAGGGAGGRSKFAITPKTKPPASRYDDSPLSSPEPEAPQLNAEIFGDSPLKPTTPGTAGSRRRYQHAPPSTSRLRFTPQPGTSVLTPAKGGGGVGKRPVWDSDDDDFGGGGGGGDFDDDDLGASPPKTMQFHIPQSRLMKTPG